MHLLYVIGISHCSPGGSTESSLPRCSETHWNRVCFKWEFWKALIVELRIESITREEAEAAIAQSHGFMESEWCDLYRSVAIFNLTQELTEPTKYATAY